MPILLAAALAVSPPPVDWNSYFLTTRVPVVVGEEASALGAKALGLLGVKTVRIEHSQYGLGLNTLSFFQPPRPVGRTCNQAIYRANALWTGGRAATVVQRSDLIRAQASGDGYRLDYLSVSYRFARADSQGVCSEEGPWIWAKDINTYSAVMNAIEQVRANRPTSAVSAFLSEPINLVQRDDPFMTVEGDTRRLVIELGPSGRVLTARLEDKPPPPLS